MSEREAKREAIERARDNAHQLWLQWAEYAAHLCAKTMDEFTSDDVWKGIPNGVTTHEGRAMGSVLARLARHGIITNTKRTRESVRVGCHNRPVTIWQSRIREPKPRETSKAHSWRVRENAGLFYVQSRAADGWMLRLPRLTPESMRDLFEVLREVVEK